jgi:hypothetical protein
MKTIETVSTVEKPPKRKRTPGKFEPRPLAEFTPFGLEHRPLAMISGEVLARTIVQKQPLSLTSESLVISFQNGLSKGFINGLEMALRFCREHQVTTFSVLCNDLEKFIKESQNEQV